MTSTYLIWLHRAALTASIISAAAVAWGWSPLPGAGGVGPIFVPMILAMATAGPAALLAVSRSARDFNAYLRWLRTRLPAWTLGIWAIVATATFVIMAYDFANFGDRPADHVHGFGATGLYLCVSAVLISMGELAEQEEDGPA